LISNSISGHETLKHICFFQNFNL